MKTSLNQQSFFNALGTVVYTSLVAGVLYNGNRLFGEKDTFFTPLFLLLLLIISATITGFLVIGKPLQLYLSDQKPAALKLLGQTLLWIIVFALVVMVGMIVF